jgi:recombination protein RecT
MVNKTQEGDNIVEYKLTNSNNDESKKIYLENKLKEVKCMIVKLIETRRSALPKSFNEARFLQNSLVVLQDTPNIEKYRPLDIARALLKGAFLGLDFFQKDCYLIPFGGILKFQIGFNGTRKLAFKYGVRPLRELYAKIVREGDEFKEFITEGKQQFIFKPEPFSDKDIIGAFAVAIFKDGSILIDSMSIKEIKSTRDVFSNSKHSKAWVQSQGEMCKKTIIKRICKQIVISFESLEQQEIYDEEIDCKEDPNGTNLISNLNKNGI